MSKVVKRVFALALSMCMLMSFSGCKQETASQNTQPQYYDYLGNIAYDSSISALVCETIEGEEEAGLVYRAVNDLNGIVSLTDATVCLYFYTSLETDTYGVNAGVEDLAEQLDGKVLFVAIDAVANRDISTSYELEALPEFVLIRNGARVSTFEGMNYSSWTMMDVALWLEDNGVVFE